MSLHWTLIAGFLYAEIGVVLLLLLPFISPKRWNSFFKSKFLKGLENQLIYYFYVLVAILVLFFLDAIREMNKYSAEQHEKTEHGSHLDAQMQMHMRLFRAQRNFYISGFALFLCLVIRRMVSLLSQNSILEAEREAAMKQAASASRAAETLLASGDNSGDNDKNNDTEVKKLKEELKDTRDELSKAKKDVESMKSQAKNISEEYDRLMEEKDKLQLKVNVLGGQDNDKKDD